MIGLLRGTLREREAERLLVDVGGVGYLLHVPASTLLGLPPREASGADGPSVELLVSTQVREDAITLYGFSTRSELRTFELLLGVSGVGPRTALAALSALGPETLAKAIAESDVARLVAVPGIGRKTAERMVVDLRDRLAAVVPEAASAASEPAAPTPEGLDVVSALVNLGYSEKQAARVVRQVVRDQEGAEPPGFDVLLREALARLSRA